MTVMGFRYSGLYRAGGFFMKMRDEGDGRGQIITRLVLNLR
jgi:hypothetical protein